MAALDVKRVCKEAKEKSPDSVKRISLIEHNIKIVNNLSDCSSLDRIDLSKNEIDDANGLGGCVKVSWINLSHNSLTSVDFASKMTQLTVLNVGYNRLQDVSQISKLTSLKALILNNNELNQLPKLDRLIHLNTLVVSHNHLESVDVTCLRSLVKLQASHNCLRSFPSVKFNAELKSLLLNENQISKVEEGSFGENRKLELIDLGKNEIRKFKHIRCLSSLPKVVNLNLKGNKLANHTSYIQKVMLMFPRLQVLDAKPRHRILSQANSSKNEKESKKRKRLSVSDSEQKTDLEDDAEIATNKTKKQKLESTSAVKKTLHNTDDDGEMAGVMHPSAESLAVEKKEKKKKKNLERKFLDEVKHRNESPTTDGDSPSTENTKKKKKSEEATAAEDLFSFGQKDDAVGNFNAVDGRRTMNKQMRELAAAVKVTDLPKSRKTKAISIGLDALLEDDFELIGEST